MYSMLTLLQPHQASVWQLCSSEDLGVCGCCEPEAPPLQALPSPGHPEEVQSCQVCHRDDGRTQDGILLSLLI